jgi:uroporphyrinogen-III synthase
MADPLTLLLTRPEAQSHYFAQALDTALPGRFTCVIAPLLKIAPVPGPLEISGARGILFTSANGVAQFVARSADRSLPAWCVGAVTAEAATEAGFVARSAEGDVHALVQLVTAECDPADGPLVHVRGRNAAGDLAGALARHGFAVRPAEIYDQRPCPPGPEARALLDARAIDVVTLYSPRSATFFAAEARSNVWDLSAVTTVSISAAADRAMTGPEPRARRVADRPDRDGMIEALSRI